MTDGFDPTGLDAVPIRAAEAVSALEALREPAERTAASIEDAFSRAGSGLARSLARAAADGEVTLAELARAVLTAFNAATATGRQNGGLADAIGQVVQSAFSGARAEGGPVSAGGAYLVGERGPEVFRPTNAGVIEPAGSGGMTVNVKIEGGSSALLRSEAQITQMFARAVALGARRL